MVELQPSKLAMRVRFPSPAPCGSSPVGPDDPKARLSPRERTSTDDAALHFRDPRRRVIDAPTDEHLWTDPKTRRTFVFFDARGPDDFDPPRTPRVRGREVVDHERGPRVHPHVLEAHRARDVEARRDDVVAVNGEHHRRHVGLAVRRRCCETHQWL